jgi:hypothetical protein
MAGFFYIEGRKKACSVIAATLFLAAFFFCKLNIIGALPGL